MSRTVMSQAEVHPSQGSARPASLAEVRERIEASDRGKWDAFAKREGIGLKDGWLVFRDETGKEERLEMTRHAQGQLCQRLGIPAAYFADCPKPLKDMQANYWLKEKARPDETWMVRADCGHARALLSKHYSPLDNAQLLDTLAPLLDPSRHKPDWFSLEDDGLHLRIIDRDLPREVRPDDTLYPGVHVRNSEIGEASLTVDALVYRLVCTNGLIALVKGKSLLRQRHVHVSAPRFQAALEEALHQAFLAANGLLDGLERTVRQHVPDPETAIEKLGKGWGLSDETQDAAKAALLDEDATTQHSAYGLVNAFTNAAQRLTDEKRYDLEVLAGHLAERGVPAFALSPSEKLMPQGEPDVRPDSSDGVIGYARQVFGARVIGRSGPREERRETEDQTTGPELIVAGGGR